MKSVNIKLSLAENVKSFVNIVNRYPYDVDLRAGRHVVDAKSILGIFSLDLSKPITLEIYTDSCDDLLSDIKPFMPDGASPAPAGPFAGESLLAKVRYPSNPLRIRRPVRWACSLARQGFLSRLSSSAAGAGKRVLAEKTGVAGIFPIL